MDKNQITVETEDKYFAPFFNKIKISIERGDGVFVYDENGKKYIDLTAGWGVTCIGHANPVITEALVSQSKKIIQGPEAGRTYSPVRAELLNLLKDILPNNLKRVFFANSGAEANDAAIKLSRKISGKKNVIATEMSFHGRTISTASATGQKSHREKYNPLMPNYIFVPFDNIKEIEKNIKDDVAVVIVEPIQGEGGVIVPSNDYLINLSGLCKQNNVHLILDEIQTGFYRTGPLFNSSKYELDVSFMTMAKGIAGGYPFAAFAMTEEVAKKLAVGDHGGTYCGNPLGCAVSLAVIKYMIETNITENVEKISSLVFDKLKMLKKDFPGIIKDIRGKGLLIAMELHDGKLALDIQKKSLNKELLINVTQGKIIRIFPALNITENEIEEALKILFDAFKKCVKND
jgi:acetylornithine/N-succinyldiaminopimelate aminotransferase